MEQHFSLRRLPILLPFSALASLSPLAMAADTVTELPSISVSSEKIERPLEKVAASIAVVDGQDIDEQGLDSLEQLEGRVPGLSFQPFGQSGVNSPVMRGLTANFNSMSTSTLLLVDGVPTLTAQGYENGLLDIERIEVMRGPQSTLYGRNAETGVIALYSRPMDNQPRARVSAEVGSRNKHGVSFAVAQPLIDDTLFASASGSWSEQDGFIDNTVSGHKEDTRKRNNLNLGLRWTPSEKTDLVLRYARQQYDDGASLWGAPTAKRETVASGTDSYNQSRGQSLSLNASQELAPDLYLRSISAYNAFDDDVQQDTDFNPADLLYIARDHQLRMFSQELRLEGKLGAADWLAGVYLDRSDNDLHTTSKTVMQLNQLYADQQSTTQALFSHWTIPLNDAWSIQAGARVEHTKVEFQPRGGASRSLNDTHFSPKLALQYQIDADHQWYFSASRGVRTSGFNLLSPGLNYAAFEPEKVWSYETGLKGWFADRRVRYSLAGYYMDIDDMQVTQMPTPGTLYITSAATATSRGIELDLDYMLGHGWQLKTGVAWNRTRFATFRDGSANYDGQHNPFAPDYTGHLDLRYDAPAGWYGQASLVGSSKVYLDAANSYLRGGYAQVNLLAGYRLQNWELAAYANNLTEQRYDAVGYQNGFVTVYSPPREFGLRLTWNR
ncbi:TonB-dependent receptor [Pseudomonas sp. LRF_L74]|uniref:TonB-dependent receptor n=1 Tax=Pseudomonas sp. LRF_L74 TaxID=3369422 RepID=UPI003F6134A5